MGKRELINKVRLEPVSKPVVKLLLHKEQTNIRCNIDQKTWKSYMRILVEKLKAWLLEVYHLQETLPIRHGIIVSVKIPIMVKKKKW